MGRKPCCFEEGLKKGAWTRKEDLLLVEYIKEHGEGGWRSLPKKAGLLRCGKSCRLRWVNYLRPGLKRGIFTPEEDDLIVRLYTLLGSRWSLIAGRIPGRTDNDIKNYWNTHLLKKLKAGGNEPRRHKSLVKHTRRRSRRTKEKTSASSQTYNQENNKEKKKKEKKKKIDEKCNIGDDKDEVATKIKEQSQIQDFVQAVSANNHNIFTCCSRSQDGTSVNSTSEVLYCFSQNIEDQNQDEIYEKLQVIDDLLLNDSCLFPPEKIIEFNYSESQNILLEEVYENYFQLVSENSVTVVFMCWHIYAEYLSYELGAPCDYFDPEKLRLRYAELLWDYGWRKNMAGAVCDSEAPQELIGLAEILLVEELLI